MSKDGGLFGTEEIDWFNGGLFDSPDVIPLTGTEIGTLLEVSRLNWALIEPAIFGTLFERGLDPNQRAQLGAHYTDRDAIWGLVEPVILRPLRREFAAMQARVTELLLSGRKVTRATPRDQDPGAVFEDFLARLRRVRVLDPACGSGNFLVVALWALKDLEYEAINWGSLVLKRPMQLPQIGPEAVLGIEINAYAAELARVTIWIGEIQWMIRHGLGYRRDPILRPLHHIETRDALLDLSDPAHPKEAEWPAAEFIVGNPPFLGNRSCFVAASATLTSRRCGRVFDDRLPHRLTSAATGTRRRATRSSASARGEQACWRPKASAVGRTDESWSGSADSGGDLLRSIGRTVVPCRSERSHQLRRPGRRYRSEPRTQRPCGHASSTPISRRVWTSLELHAFLTTRVSRSSVISKSARLISLAPLRGGSSVPKSRWSIEF